MGKQSPRNSKTVEADLTVPVDEELSQTLLRKADKDEGDCFTKDWNPSTTACSTCADNEICSILMRKRGKKKAKKIEAESGVKFLDESDFKGVNEKNLKKTVVDYGDVTLDELHDTVKKLSKCDDMEAVRLWTGRFMDRNGLSEKEGYVNE